MARDHLAFKLKLHDGGRLLHTGHRDRLAHARAFNDKARRRVVCVHGASEQVQRGHRDAVAFLQLRQTPVA